MGRKTTHVAQKRALQAAQVLSPVDLTASKTVKFDASFIVCALQNIV
jgi:hypothetical protein